MAKASGSNTAANAQKTKTQPTTTQLAHRPRPAASAIWGHSAVRTPWTTFRNTQVVCFYSGARWKFTPALTRVTAYLHSCCTTTSRCLFSGSRIEVRKPSVDNRNRPSPKLSSFCTCGKHVVRSRSVWVRSCHCQLVRLRSFISLHEVSENLTGNTYILLMTKLDKLFST